ncbi:MAG TPA: NAD(P)H-dependent glycerol-3-phosphate dehydrogenase [Candidatus Ozemobacteraceae bacterium]|nr:NAD(P)H-dependent glycerol-3-phosphate dehydrogenase [Candidatus Ozemobacteraceae bacterium]
MNIGVIGAGSWGTVLATLLSKKGNEVTLWAREPEVVAGIRNRRRNPFFMNTLELPPELGVTDDADEVASRAEALLFAIPSMHLRGMAHRLGRHLARMKGIINAAKGFEPATGKRLSEILVEEAGVAPGSADDHVAIISGPNLAGELAEGKIGATVAACPDTGWAQTVQELLSTEQFRVYRHTDRAGVELGGTLKNVFAIGAGIVDGLGLGDNAKAAYLTRALHELVRLGTRLGGRPTTFYGLSGLGDLMATCSSPLSRNHQLGQALARGQTLAEISGSSRMVIEGVETARMAAEWGKKLTIPLPITEEICRVLFDGLPPREAARNLMTRSLKDEEA